MDDYRDLVTVSLVLACAGFMLVAGQLYIEHSGGFPSARETEAPASPATSPALISRAPPAQENLTKPGQALDNEHQG